MRHRRAEAGWYLDALGGGIIFFAAVGLNAIANANDVTAFAALADMSTYAWLGMGLLCWCGTVFASAARRAGNPPPVYFRVVLLLGVACTLITISIPLRIFQKSSEPLQIVAPLKHVDLSGQTVSDRDLGDQDLRRARLSAVLFQHVDLSGADLSEADLRTAVFDDVDLGGAKLCGADLRGADLRGARNLESVRDWAYAFYNNSTALPDGHAFIAMLGPVKDTGRGLLYMCRTNETRHVRS